VQSRWPRYQLPGTTAKSGITSIILGASKPEQLTDLLAAADLVLDAEIMTELDNVTVEFRKGDALR